MNLKLAAIFFAAATLTTAQAQDYPTQPITLIAPFAAGGTSDVIARLISERMGDVLGQRIVVENASSLARSLGVVPSRWPSQNRK